MKNIFGKIYEKREDLTLLSMVLASLTGWGLMAYGDTLPPKIKTYYTFNYCGKEAKVIKEERKFLPDREYILLNDNTLIPGKIIGDNLDTISVDFDGYYINGELNRW